MNTVGCVSNALVKDHRLPPPLPRVEANLPTRAIQEQAPNSLTPPNSLHNQSPFQTLKYNSYLTSSTTTRYIPAAIYRQRRKLAVRRSTFHTALPTRTNEAYMCVYRTFGTSKALEKSNHKQPTYVCQVVRSVDELQFPNRKNAPENIAVFHTHTHSSTRPLTSC